jgi:chemotaxis protein CheD
MSACETEVFAIYLKPGEMFVSDKKVSVTTVLGSCISVTFFNPRFKIGAICHGMLPMCKKDESCTGTCDDGLRYIECSINRMLKEFTSLGIGHSEIEVKVFGGSDMFKTDVQGGNSETVGMQNTKIALGTIKEHNLILKASDTGGPLGRKVIFFTHTGEVLLKRLGKTELDMPV